jgi:hypothetical protein
MANLKMASDSDYILTTCSDIGGEGESTIIGKGSYAEESSLKESRTIKASTIDSTSKMSSTVGNVSAGNNRYGKAISDKEYEIGEFHLWGDIIRITLIIGGIAYLVTMPVHSIPLAVIVGGITITLSAIEIAALVKKHSIGEKAPPVLPKDRTSGINQVQDLDRMLNKIPNSKITYRKTQEVKRNPESKNEEDDIFKL